MYSIHQLSYLACFNIKVGYFVCMSVYYRSSSKFTLNKIREVAKSVKPEKIPDMSSIAETISDSDSYICISEPDSHDSADNQSVFSDTSTTPLSPNRKSSMDLPTSPNQITSINSDYVVEQNKSDISDSTKLFRIRPKRSSSADSKKRLSIDSKRKSADFSDTFTQKTWSQGNRARLSLGNFEQGDSSTPQYSMSARSLFLSKTEATMSRF